MMTEEIGRAFTVRQMSREQKSALHLAETQMKPNECYAASQIAKDFLNNQRQVELNPLEVNAMERCWADFYKTILGPQRLYEDSIHPTDCSMTTCKHPWDNRCKTRAQEMWQWEDFAYRHYKAPQVAGQNLEQAIGLVLALLMFWK